MKIWHNLIKNIYVQYDDYTGAINVYDPEA